MKNLYRKPSFIAQNGKHGSYAAGCPAEHRYNSGGLCGCDTTCGKIMGFITMGMWSVLCCFCTLCGCRSTTNCHSCEMVQ